MYLEVYIDDAKRPERSSFSIYNRPAGRWEGRGLSEADALAMLCKAQLERVESAARKMLAAARAARVMEPLARPRELTSSQGITAADVGEIGGGEIAMPGT
jgi:hypothetical protein